MIMTEDAATTKEAREADLEVQPPTRSPKGSSVLEQIEHSAEELEQGLSQFLQAGNSDIAVALLDFIQGVLDARRQQWQSVRAQIPEWEKRLAAQQRANVARARVVKQEEARRRRAQQRPQQLAALEAAAKQRRQARLRELHALEEELAEMDAPAQGMMTGIEQQVATSASSSPPLRLAQSGEMNRDVTPPPPVGVVTPIKQSEPSVNGREGTRAARPTAEHDGLASTAKEAANSYLALQTAAYALKRQYDELHAENELLSSLIAATDQGGKGAVQAVEEITSRFPNVYTGP